MRRWVYRVRWVLAGRPEPESGAIDLEPMIRLIEPVDYNLLRDYPREPSTQKVHKWDDL